RAAGIAVMRVGGTAPDAARATDIIDISNGTEPLRAALSAHHGPLLLTVDAHGSGNDHPAATLFERFLSVCERGQHLLIGERSAVSSRARRGFLASALGCRRGRLLSPDSADGAMLDVSLPRRATAVIPGRGVWVDDGVSTPIQVARPSRSGAAHNTAS